MTTRKRTIKAAKRPRKNPADHKLYLAAQKADDAWQAELKHVFGARAGDARYDKRGSSTPKLKKLKTAFDKATTAMRKSWENPAKRKRNTTIIKARQIGKVIIRRKPSVANPYLYQIQFQQPGGTVQHAGAYYTSSRTDALKQAETDLKRRKLWKPKTKLITGAVPLNSIAARHKNSKRKSKTKSLAKLAVKGLTKKNPKTSTRHTVFGGRGEFGSSEFKTPQTEKLRRRLNLLTSKWAKASKASDLAKIKKQIDATWAQLNQAGVKNPASKRVRQLRESFTGLKSRKTALMNAPKGTPANLAKLGKLVSIKAAKGTLRPGRRNPGSTVWLCADARGKLHLCTTGARLIDGPAQSFGEVREIEYEAIKPHLGHKRPTIFFHHMGEEGGKRPELRADGAGGLKIIGGNYYITPEGIRD